MHAGQTKSNPGQIQTLQESIFTNGTSFLPFKHTGEEWIKVTDQFNRWCWYRGVVAPAESNEITVLADCSLFLTAESWDVCVGVNVGSYGDDGVEYSATRSVGKH